MVCIIGMGSRPKFRSAITKKQIMPVVFAKGRTLFIQFHPFVQCLLF